MPDTLMSTGCDLDDLCVSGEAGYRGAVTDLVVDTDASPLGTLPGDMIMLTITLGFVALTPRTHSAVVEW